MKLNNLTHLIKVFTVYVNVFSLLIAFHFALPQATFGAKPSSPDKYSQIELKIKIGGKLPDLQLEKVGGGATKLSNVVVSGHKSIVVMWATWCSACARLMTSLEKSRVSLQSNKINLVGINADIEKNAPIGSFIADKKLQLPIYVGGIEADKRIFAKREVAVPLTIFLDENGTVTDYGFGLSDKIINNINTLAQ
ncbi:MAG: TlpA family protein disulfide reductase [Pyrinomonadaceae bacterium]|nr:TlpA family protein disulfide reductase [Pyrinomonadaceae bacterium]